MVAKLTILPKIQAMMSNINNENRVLNLITTLSNKHNSPAHTYTVRPKKSVFFKPPPKKSPIGNIKDYDAPNCSLPADF